MNYDLDQQLHKLKINFKLPVIIEDINKKGGKKSTLNNKCFRLNQIKPVGNYSTVTDAFSKVSLNKAYNLKLSVEFVSSNLWTPKYSDYQQFLYDTIASYTKKGWTYLEIAEWLNKSKYLTPRGKKFKANHVWSIHMKKKRSIERFSREYDPEITNLGIDVIDY